MIEIFNRYTNALLYRSDSSASIKEAVESAAADGASLVRARLDGARLVGASLVRARLDGARLDGARLVGARLDGARLDGARLDGASLVRASLVGASLVGASLDGARLDGARLDGASLPDGMFIMQIMASCGYLVALSTPEGLEVRSGCQHHLYEWWIDNGKQLGRDEGYSDGQIAEYDRHFAYIAEWHKIVRGTA